MLPIDLHPLVGDLQGVAGIIVHDLDTGDEMTWNPDERFVAASLIKLPILWQYFCEYGAQRLDPDEIVVLRAEDRVPGFGVLKSLEPGLPLRLRDLATLMIVVSDNIATNLLIDRLGIEAINRAIQGLGMTHTVLMRKMFDYRDPAKNNFTSPRDMVRILHTFAENDDLPAALHAELLHIMRGQQCRNKLPSALPRSVKLAHKTGDMPQIEHDAGIFFGADHRVIAVVMTRDLARNLDGVRLCRQVGEAVFAYAGP